MREVGPSRADQMAKRRYDHHSKRGAAIRAARSANCPVVIPARTGSASLHEVGAACSATAIQIEIARFSGRESRSRGRGVRETPRDAPRGRALGDTRNRHDRLRPRPGGSAASTTNARHLRLRQRIESGANGGCSRPRTGGPPPSSAGTGRGTRTATAAPLLHRALSRGLRSRTRRLRRRVATGRPCRPGFEDGGARSAHANADYESLFANGRVVRVGAALKAAGPAARSRSRRTRSAQLARRPCHPKP